MGICAFIAVEAIVLNWIKKAIERLKSDGFIPSDYKADIYVEPPKHERFGDFGCVLPLHLARTLKKPPQECARAIIAAMDIPQDVVESVEFAPPGYINFRLRPEAWFSVLKEIREAPEKYGNSEVGKEQRILLEFVSANPTGPLHVGHGRGAVLGDALARMLRAAGYQVETEYYINDVGKQLATLGRSVWARGRELLGLTSVFPEDGYRGDYIRDIAVALIREYEPSFRTDYELLGPPDRTDIVEKSVETLLQAIRNDLDSLGISFDNWFSERSLYERGLVQKCIEELLERGLAYKDSRGAVLLRMTGEEDEEDRVIVRSNGVPTYFASDIAYHRDKFERGFSRLINIWGADHHGYVPRVKAALQGLEIPPDILEIILVQMVTLTRGSEIIPMGKRTGEFVTLRDVIEEVGQDAVRFLFLMRKADAHMEFDLELAKAQTLENPVFYVQYGHARVAAILRKAMALGLSPPQWRKDLYQHLVLKEEQALIKDLARFPGVVASSAKRREPHHVAFYLMDLVKGFHSYYTKYKHTEKVISKDTAKTEARLLLALCVKSVLARGLGLLGVRAPEEMFLPGGEDERE